MLEPSAGKAEAKQPPSPLAAACKASGKPVHLRMHSWLLFFQPSAGWEQQYWAQLEGLDLLNCLITPIFFASTLSRWPRSFLAGVYCVVLAIKGYQMALLLLPSARQARAHSKARYGLIFAERALRQFIATPALGRGPRFVQWMQEITAADPGPATAFKLAMLVSGVTHAFWNAFCLPLDIVSQVVINAVFFCIHFGPTVTQVAYPLRMLVKHKPRLAWAQWRLEGAASRLASPLLQLATLGQQQQHLQQERQCSNNALAAELPPKRAPDLESPAGRLVLASSAALMLYLVLYVPLLFAWRLERHLKSRFMLTVAHKQSGGDISVFDATSSVSSPSSSAVGSSGKLGASACDAAGKGGNGSSDSKPGVMAAQASGYVAPPVVFPVLPPTASLATHLTLAAAACFLAGEVFVWMCCVSPTVAGILWEQVPG